MCVRNSPMMKEEEQWKHEVMMMDRDEFDQCLEPSFFDVGLQIAS